MAKSKSTVKYAIVDAFANSVFRGNPAAVCLLEEERGETWLRLVNREFNAPVTCFLTRISNPDSSSIPGFMLRWFVPATEVKICGHGTLAASHFCFTSGLVKGDLIEFTTLSGILTAKKKSTTPDKSVDQHLFVELDFPILPLIDYDSSEISSITEAVNGAYVVDIKWSTNEDDLIVVLNSAEAVADLKPQIEKIRRCPGRGVIVTGLAPPESEYDFFSRFFFPKIGLNEDAVCGSAHCALASYWAKKLGKQSFLAYAASSRSGVVKLQLDEHNERVLLQGKAVTVMEGSLLV